MCFCSTLGMYVIQLVFLGNGQTNNYSRECAWHTTCDFKGYFIEELDKTMFAPIILTPYKYAIKW